MQFLQPAFASSRLNAQTHHSDIKKIKLRFSSMPSINHKSFKFTQDIASFFNIK